MKFMNIIVRGKNIDVTTALKEYVEKRVSKLDKYFDGIEEAQATLIVEKDTHRVEVTVPVNGIILRGEEETGDMYNSIDRVIEKIEKQIAKYKTKLSKQLRNTPFVTETLAATQIKQASEPEVKKTKRFAVKPMPIDEAIMQMNLIGHNFFVFSNAETEEVNVVYKRKDGNYGLIEPEY